jgi:hypothetical protein
LNLNKLRQAEDTFLMHYPGGFYHPEMQAIGKKHKMDKMIGLAQAGFAKPQFKDTRAVAETMVKLVSRSSMVSLFEKPRFRDFVAMLSAQDCQQLTGGLKAFLHGSQQQGFEAMLDILQAGKLAKWTLMTILPCYFNPTVEVFVKPTTTKGVIAQFELDELQYRPMPSWDFYQRYRACIQEMKAVADESLTGSNAAFCGFLMMSLPR